MVARAEIRVEGLAELRRALRKAEDVETSGELRDGLKKATGIVADEAQTRVPSRSGRARDAIRPQAAGNKALVVGGKASVPYYGWLDYGSRTPITGNARSVGPWSGSGRGPARGRFIYPALDAKEREVVDAVADAVMRALDKIGI